MNFEEFKKEALITESVPPQDTLIDMVSFNELTRRVVDACADLDQLKKKMFYDKQPTTFNYVPTKASPIDLRLVQAILGIATEAGELLDELVWSMVQKEITPSIELNLKEEFGDIEWYKSEGYDALGFDEEDIRSRVLSKLRARYGESFSQEKAINRDLDAENEALNHMS